MRLMPTAVIFVAISLSLAACTSNSGGDSTSTAAAATIAGQASPPPASATASTASPAPAMTPAGGPPTHEGSRALAHVAELAKTPRVSGTPGEDRAAQYIRAQFTAAGYATEIIEFEYEGDQFRAGSVKAGSAAVEGLTLAGSTGGTASGPAIYVGIADAESVRGKDLRGKIAVADRGAATFNEKFTNVANAGAISLVVVNNRAGSFNGNLTTEARIPVVSVSQEDGAAILAAARAGSNIAVDAPPTVGSSKAKNVVARPRAGSSCEILVGGHYDTVPGAAGANDNASGTANVLELGRALAADGLDEGLCFATFGAEESGLHGSKDFVDQLRGESGLPQYFLNLDVTGIGTGAQVIGDPEFVQEVLEVARELNIPALKSSLPANSGSDHQSFDAAGVPAVWFFSGEFETIHSPEDVTGDIDEAELDRLGELAYAVITKLLARVAQG